MAKIIAVVSGKGGTGKSTISAGLAKAIATMGKSVLAVDLDIGLRALDIMLELQDKVVFDIGDIIDGKCSPKEAVVAHPAKRKLHLLCSPVNVSKSFNIPRIVDLIKSLSESYDYIILDLPAGLGLSVIMSREVADVVAIIATPDMVTLRDTQKIGSIIEANCSTPCRLVVNRVCKLSMQTSGIDDIDQMIDTIGAQLMAIVPEDEWINVPEDKKPQKRNGPPTDEVFAAMAERVNGQYVPLVIKSV